jgi:hypothetical protein
MDHNQAVPLNGLNNGHNYSIFGDLDPNNLKPAEEPFMLKGRWYVLREASKDADVAYRSAQMKNLQLMEKDGERHMTTSGAAEADPVLLSYCLYYGDGEGKLVLRGADPDPRYRVPLATILSWPTRLVDPLVKRLKEMSNIEQERTREQLEKDIKDATEAIKRLDSKEGKDPTKGKETLPDSTPSDVFSSTEIPSSTPTS